MSDLLGRPWAGIEFHCSICQKKELSEMGTLYLAKKWKSLARGSRWRYLLSLRKKRISVRLIYPYGPKQRKQGPPIIWISKFAWNEDRTGYQDFILNTRMISVSSSRLKIPVNEDRKEAKLKKIYTFLYNSKDQRPVMIMTWAVPQMCWERGCAKSLNYQFWSWPFLLDDKAFRHILEE